MAKILITGGAGFIGSHLCARLLNEGHQVICLDNFYTGQQSNIAPLLSNPRFELINHDICNPVHLQADAIYNLACAASPVFYQKEPIETVKTNVLGILNMLQLARDLSIPILQASTSEVYGDPSVHPQTESYFGNVNNIGVRACYDEGKRCAETLCYDYHRQYDVDIKVIRIFNTYGANMSLNDGRVVSNFITQALKHTDITVYGDGQQTRSLCYVDDLIDGMVRVMQQPKYHQPINLGNPKEMTILELAKQIITACHSKANIVYKALPEDDPKQRCPDISRANNLLKWQPKVSLEDGLKHTITYFQKKLASTQ